MSFFGGSSNNGAVVDKPNYTGLQIQTSVNTLPIPIVYGQNRIAPNLIDYEDYSSQSDNAQSGGKGGGSSSSDSQTYYATVVMGLCEGPINGVGQVWANSTTATGYAALGFTLFNGPVPQAPWGYMLSAHPARALNYPGTAYLAQANYKLGASPDLPNHNMEVNGIFFSSSAVSGNPDADMAQVIYDFLTNAQYGVGFPASSIDLTTLYSVNFRAGHGYAGSNDSSYQAYCAALGLFMSPALTSQESASSILQRWLQLTNTAAVWSGTALKFIPYGDQPVSGNGVTFTPDATPIYDLDDDDFMAGDNEDPVEITRSDLADAKNCVRLEIADRSTHYNLVPIEAKDQNAIELYGLRVDSSITAHEICDPVTCAPMAAQLILQRNIHIRNTYTFKLSWEYCLLEPMDLVTLTDPALGLNKTAVRITAIEEDENGFLTVTAEEFPAGIATASLYPKQSRSPYTVNYNQAAEPVNPPVIFEPTAALLGNDPAQIWIGASGGVSGVADPYWGGCDVYVSADNATYQKVGRIEAPARQGTLTASLASASGTDTAHTLAVDLTESGGVLGSGGTAGAAAGRTLIWVASDGGGGEIMAYGTATLTSASHYNVTYLERGLYGTAPASHGAGSAFLRLDQAVFKYDLPGGYVGVPLYIKLPSFNIWGGGAESLADAHAYGLTPAGTGFYSAPPAGNLAPNDIVPAMPTGLAATGGQNCIVTTWNANAERDVQYTLFSAEGHDSAFGDAAIIATGLTGTSYTHVNLGYGETRGYWLEAYTGAGASSPAGPAFATTSYNLPIAAIGSQAITDSLLVPWLSAQIDTGADSALQDVMNAVTAQMSIVSADIAARNDLQAYTDSRMAVEQSLRRALEVSVAASNASYTEQIDVLAAGSVAAAASLTALGASVGANTGSLINLGMVVATNASATASSFSALSGTVASNYATLDALIVNQGSIEASTSAALAGSISALDASLVSVINGVSSTLDAAILTQGSVMAGNSASLNSAIAALSTTLSAETGSLSAAVATEQSARIAADGTIEAQYGIKVQTLGTSGMKAIAGLGLLSDIIAGNPYSEIVLLATEVIIANVDTLGNVSTVAPFVLSNGTAVIQSAMIDQVSFNAMTGGTVTSELLVVAPSDASGGLKVYNTAGSLVLDPTHGIYPGAVTSLYTGAGSSKTNYDITSTSESSPFRTVSLTASPTGTVGVWVEGFIAMNVSNGAQSTGSDGDTYINSIELSVDFKSGSTVLDTRRARILYSSDSVEMYFKFILPAGTYSFAMDLYVSDSSLGALRASTSSGPIAVTYTSPSITLIDYRA